MKSTFEIKDKHQINVLVMGAGSPLGQSIFKALSFSKLPIKFYLADIRLLAAGFYLNKSSTNIILPFIKDSSYKKELTNIIKYNRIQCIFPVIEREHHFFAENNRLWKQLGVKIVTNAEASHDLASDKFASFAHLKECGITVPDTICADNEKARDAFLKCHQFPFILKPRFGVSSENIFTVKNHTELNGLLHVYEPAKFVIQEYLSEESEEYTVGVYISKDGTWKQSFVIKRELKFGLSYTGMVVKNELIQTYAQSVSQALGLQYASNVQLRMAHGIPYVFEINPRLSSTSSIRAFFGYNEPEMILTELFGDIHTYSLTPKTGSFMRYWEEIYIPE